MSVYNFDDVSGVKQTIDFDNFESGFYNVDCMDIMRHIPDKFFELAIVDPPYGINISKVTKYGTVATANRLTLYTQGDWDNARPNAEYWVQLFRISKNQIVWGGNFFTEYLPVSQGWVVWNKLLPRGVSFGHCELVWTSFNRKILRYDIAPSGDCGNTAPGKNIPRFHQSQKAVRLYKMLLNDFANEGDKILDTHVGSASSLVACHEFGFKYLGFELDGGYFDKAKARLETALLQNSFELDGGYFDKAKAEDIELFGMAE
jgi:site-specific DNA-methyltransferase (adenine-specific)